MAPSDGRRLALTHFCEKHTCLMADKDDVRCAKRCRCVYVCVRVRVCVSQKREGRRRESDRERKRSGSFVHRQRVYGRQSVTHVVWFLTDKATYFLTHDGTNTAVVPSGTNTKQSSVVNTTKQAANLKYS